MLNSVTVMGRLVAEPELRQTSNGVSTTSFTIAVERNYVKPGEERQTDFIDIVAWRGTAEFICKYFHKGSLIALTGEINTHIWEDKETKKKRKSTEIIVSQASFTGEKSDNRSQGTSNQTSSQSMPSDESGFKTGPPDDFAVVDDSEDLPF